MISRITAIATAILLLGLTDGLSQELKPGADLPEISDEQKISRLQNNFNAMAVGFITYAKENDSSISDAGHWLGKLFARSWGDNLTPEGFVRGMSGNWQMLNIKTEILDVTSDYVKAKRSIVMADSQFQNTFQNYGVSLSEYQEFFSAVQKGIANSFGLTFSEEAEGNSLVFTVGTGN